MSKKKIIIIIPLLIFFCLFVFLSLIIIDQMVKNDKKYENVKIDDCINRQNDLNCIKNNTKDKENCKDVINNPNNYYSESVEKCKIVMGLN